MNVFDKGDPSSIGKARKLAEEVFGEGWEGKGAAIYDEGPQEVNVWGIGQWVLYYRYFEHFLMRALQLPYRFGVALAVPRYTTKSGSVMGDAGGSYGTIP
jgi:hypothetical protein